MATVAKRGAKWSAIYTDFNGKQKWKTGYADKQETQRLAQRLEDEQRKIKLGDIDIDADLKRIERSKTIAGHILEYKTSLQAAGRSVGHVKYTIADIEKLVAFSGTADGGNVLIKSASEITVVLIDSWVLDQIKRQKAEEKYHANKTINRRVSSVQQFLRRLAENGGVSKYALKRYPKLPTGEANKKRFSRAFTRTERDTLLADTQKPARQPLHQFAALTGLRSKEIRQIIPEYCDFEHNTIKLPAHITKSKVVQTVPIHPALLPALKTRCEAMPQDQPLFKMPVQKCLNRNLRSDCKRLGIDTKNIGFHCFRHTFCTLLARANVHPALLQKLARHSQLSTTLGYYVHLEHKDESEALARI